VKDLANSLGNTLNLGKVKESLGVNMKKESLIEKINKAANTNL
jgi:hypothetical protein